MDTDKHRSRKHWNLPPEHLAKFRLKPTRNVYYKLGLELSKRMQPVATLEQVGRRFGMTKQNAYHATVIALGKLAHGLIKSVNFETR